MERALGRVQELVGSGADPLMTLGSDPPLLPPCPETLSWGWGRPPSGLLGGSSEVQAGAMTASLGRLGSFFSRGSECSPVVALFQVIRR